MKTIELLSNGRQVQFTTKSVTIDGKEYLYSHISELRHSEAKRVYGFKCDGEVVMLPYAEKDTRVLKAIFSQVRQMHSKPAPAKAGPAVTEAPAAEQSAKPGPAPVQEPAAEPEAKAPAAEPAAEPVVTPEPVPAAEPVAPVEPAAETTEVETEVPAEPAAETPAEEPAEPILSDKERRKQQKQREKEQRKAEKEAAKREKLAQKAAAKSGGADIYSESVSAQVDQMQKSARFKKAILIFVIILAVFALMGVAYYFLIGPASDPQIGPNTTDQTQYNDIDNMINDLEN